MSGAADKARFHLEQSVPELREWERREIFTRAEISSIARQRSNFEHTIASRGASTPATYARYAAYELNLAALARKRIQRRGLKSLSSTSAHAGQKRVLGIFERATRKHHGSLELWLQYLEHCRSLGARKRLQRALTECARLFPTRPDVWIWAARWESDTQGDVGAARSWMQRGLRFNPRSSELYVEYARLEMAFVAKIAARRKILGLDEEQNKSIEDAGDATEKSLDEGADEIALPSVSAEELALDDADDNNESRSKRSRSGLDEEALAKLANSPALAGAIPEAILDAAMRQFTPGQSTARLNTGVWALYDTLIGDFFNMFVSFIGSAPCATRLAHAVLDRVQTPPPDTTPPTPTVTSCRCRLPLLGLPLDDARFPRALRQSLQLVRDARSATTGPDTVKLDAALLAWLRPLLQQATSGSDGDSSEEGAVTKNKTAAEAPELAAVLRATIRRLSSGDGKAGGDGRDRSTRLLDDETTRKAITDS